jgi:hypothetical protein
MASNKIVYVSKHVHMKLKILSAQRGRPMGKVLEELVESELEDLANPWVSPDGLSLQQDAFESAWDDPDMDVYNET